MGISHKSKICLAHGSLVNLEGDSRTDCMNGEPLDYTVAVIRYTHTAALDNRARIRPHVDIHTETQRRKPSRAAQREPRSPGITISSLMHRAFGPLLRSACR